MAKKLTARQQYWFDHHKAWEKSGSTQAEYCKNKSISLYTFRSTRTQLNKVSRQSHFVAIPESSIVKAMEPVSTTGSGLTLCLNSNLKIEIAKDFSSYALVKLIKVLETA